jgi:hypothetical protein
MTDWTRVQGTNTATGSGTTNSLAFGAAVTSGNIVRGGVLLTHGSFITNVTDDKGNVYRVTVSGDDNTTLYAALFRSLHLVTNGPTTITVTVSPSSATFWIVIDEFAPPTGTTDISLDGGQVELGTLGTLSAPFRITKPDTLVYSISFSSGTSTTGAGFTAGQGSGTARCSEWLIQATASDSVEAVYATQTASSWMVIDAIAPVAPTTWEPIQRQIQRTGSGTTASVTLPNPVSPGNIVVGSIAISGVLASVLTSLQDDKGHAYQLIAGTVGNPAAAGDRQIFWSNGLINNAPQTITATFNTSQTVAFFLIDEFAPPPNTVSVAIDGTPANTTNATTGGTTTVNTPNVTTTHGNDLAYSFGDMFGSSTTPNNSFSDLNGQNFSWSDAWQIWPTARTANASWIHGSSTGSENASLVVFSSQQPTPALLYREDHRPKAYPSGTIGTITPSDTTVITPTCSVLLVSCTGAGVVAVRMLDGNVALIPVPVGIKALDIQYDQVKVTGTTATATFVGLYNL